MKKFEKLTAIAAPLSLINIDTDMIIPKQFLKTIRRSGLGRYLFYDMRYDKSGGERGDFVLNKVPYREAQIIIAGDNFGCGSSREHAPWALLDFGIRCVISTSFADIFYNNCFKNSILPIRLAKDQVDILMRAAEGSDSDGDSGGDNAKFEIDLGEQTITDPNGNIISFDIDPFRKECLLNGWDDIGLTEQKENKISGFEEKNAENLPWLYCKKQ